MSALKNNFNLENREQNQSVVQRFITSGAVSEDDAARNKAQAEPENAAEPKYILFNAMEETVKEEVRATMNNMNVCKCDKCYYDVCAMVLNNSPPQYVTSPEGVLIKKAAALLRLEVLTKLSGEIFNAISVVKENPGH